MSREFLAALDGAFAALTEDIEIIAKGTIANVAEDAVVRTPGPGNQFPPETRYKATGRLRASMEWGESFPGTVSRMDGGPYDVSTDGRSTARRLRTEILNAPLTPISYLSWTVGYAYLVHEAPPESRHVLPRPFAQEAADRAPQALAAAIAQSRVGQHG